MHERKRGTLKSGRSGKKATSRKQAIAIGLSKAPKAGAKVPPKKGDLMTKSFPIEDLVVWSVGHLVF